MKTQAVVFATICCAFAVGAMIGSFQWTEPTHQKTKDCSQFEATVNGDLEGLVVLDRDYDLSGCYPGKLTFFFEHEGDMVIDGRNHIVHSAGKLKIENENSTLLLKDVEFRYKMIDGADYIPVLIGDVRKVDFENVILTLVGGTAESLGTYHHMRVDSQEVTETYFGFMNTVPSPGMMLQATANSNYE